MLGSWTALIAKVLFLTPVIVRTGYVLTIFYDELKKPLWMRWIATALEAVVYGLADGVITSSPRGHDYVEDRYLVRGDHRMIPNYIETDVFKPLPVDSVDGSICYVGRLAEQKNLSSLIRAVGETPYSLTVVGSGELRADLEQLADQVDAKVTFRGRVPNHELPEILNAHEVFVLPSHFEGMPKTLLEAMACGRPVVGTAVKGTAEVVIHEENGLLCETDPDSIRDALNRLLTDEDLRDRLGTAARATILSEYSLERIVERETDLYASIR
jgi:glycosyltransferase involved in cell wall biosynthesis